MLQVVSQSSGIGRVMFTPCTDRDFRIKAGLFVVLGEVHVQSVVQLVDVGIQRIIFVLCVYPPVPDRLANA